jgi:hypothetical protein
MTSNDETEPTLAAMETASEAVRAANHAAYHAPATPESLYDRTGVLVELLGRLRQVAFTLGNHAERALSDAVKSRLLYSLALGDADCQASPAHPWERSIPSRVTSPERYHHGRRTLRRTP